MKFKGTIIITDPSYIIRENTKDWDKCNYGENFENLGITHYISEPTIYGDWSCTTYKAAEPYKIVNELAESYRDNKEYSIKNKAIGEFCADAGMVAVFLLNEIVKYNSDAYNFIFDYSRCVTIIPDFDGEVEYYVDLNNEAHIIGIGNINFFTTQTGA